MAIKHISIKQPSNKQVRGITITKNNPDNSWSRKHTSLCRQQPESMYRHDREGATTPAGHPVQQRGFQQPTANSGNRLPNQQTSKHMQQHEEPASI
jgi:hypothetical protein